MKRIIVLTIAIAGFIACNQHSSNTVDPNPSVINPPKQDPGTGTVVPPPPPTTPPSADHTKSKLAVTSITLSSPTIHRNDQFKINVIVQNRGTTISNNFNVEVRALLVNDPSHATDLPIGTGFGQALAPGESRQLSIPNSLYPLSAPGTYLITPSIESFQSGIEQNAPQVSIIVN